MDNLKSGGEDKKNSGQLGEVYVSNFLKLIGWKNPISGRDIACLESEKHHKPNETHGVDNIYTYNSSLEKGRLIHNIVSVKHTTNTYKNSDFKKHFSDLANTIDCYENSLLFKENREGTDTFKPDQIVGILFWISSESDRTKSILAELNYRLPIELNYDRIQIMDNDRIEFITNSINVVKKRFDKYKLEFYYIDTPNNTGDRLYAGKQLPVEMFNCDIQIFRLQKNEEIILAIVIKDEFHPDELKRIFGLAHTISNNLTNNVSIFFPLFEHQVQRNINIVNEIKGLFKDKDFIDTTNIYGYDIGFKDVIETIEISDEITNEEITQLKDDNGKILPYGDHLRNFINNSSISESELNIFLKRKGIYICKHTKKEFTIPIVSSMLLSPKEFEILKSHHEISEHKDKRFSSSLDTASKVTGDDLIKVLKSIDLNQIAKSKFPNYQFTIPKADFKLDYKNKQLILTYEIESYYRNRSWDEQINNFKGTVIFDYSSTSLEIISENIYSSNETLEINRRIINYAKIELKKANIIKSLKENKILMNDLTYTQIFQFLLSFTNNNLFRDIEFNNITSIDIEFDTKKDIPDNSNIKWMESYIKKLKLDGAKIEEIEIIKKVEYHKYLKCWGIIAEYKFDTYKAKGSASIKLEFHKSTGEFMIIMDKYNFDKKLYTQKIIDKLILQEINNIKHNKYKEIKNDSKNKKIENKLKNKKEFELNTVN